MVLQEDVEMGLLNLLGRGRDRKRESDILENWQPYVSYTLTCDDCGIEFELYNSGAMGVGNPNCGVLPGDYEMVGGELIHFLGQAIKGGWVAGILSKSKKYVNYCPYCHADHLLNGRKNWEGSTWVHGNEGYTPTVTALNLWKPLIEFDTSCAYCCKKEVRQRTYDHSYTALDFIIALQNRGWTSMADEHGDVYTACPYCMLVWKTDSEGYDYLGVMRKAEYAQLAGVK
jgi:ribosome modulation factor